MILGLFPGSWKEGKKGEKRGREAAMRETARNLLRKGISVEMITEVTGITIEEITRLADQEG